MAELFLTTCFSTTLLPLQTSSPDYYATLGLDRNCTTTQVRTAYRLLSKQHHPDTNPDSPEAAERMRELNAAYETLSDPYRRRAYDRELSAKNRGTANGGRAGKIERNISREVNLRLEDFFRGTTLEVKVNDPANPGGEETYQLSVPPNTAPNTRFKLPRESPFEGGFINIRARMLPHFRFKARGSDLRCDLRIKPRRASEGGLESISGPTGARLSVQIPRGAGRGEILTIRGEGLPKPRGGRGDLQVRITYQPEVRVSRKFI